LKPKEILNGQDSLFGLFCGIDDFCKVFLPVWNRQLPDSGQKRRQRARSLTTGEIMTILIAFHQSHYRDFKRYYNEYVLKTWRSEFPGLVSTVIDQLKNISQIEHSRHRSISNFFVNVLCGLIAYCRCPAKPSLGLNLPTTLVA